MWLFAFLSFNLKYFTRLSINMSFPEHNVNVEEDIEQRSKAAWLHKFHVHNQNFVVLSIVETEGKHSAIKVFGTFATLEEANRVSREISAQNDFFDVLVGDTSEWLPVPCTREFVENVHYQEEKMEEIREGFTKIKERNAQKIMDSIKQDREQKKSAQLVDKTAEKQH